MMDCAKIYQTIFTLCTALTRRQRLFWYEYNRLIQLWSCSYLTLIHHVRIISQVSTKYTKVSQTTTGSSTKLPILLSPQRFVLLEIKVKAHFVLIRKTARYMCTGVWSQK